MINDEATISNIPELKTISSSSSSRDRVINTTSEDRGSTSNDSSGSSPSDLRRRLEDLPSPNEFTLLADRVAALSRRICRKRELFLRLHGVANRIEENDEWEEENEQRAGFESSLRAPRPKDARARRRARIRLESSPRRDAQAMVISQAGGSTGPSKITDDDNDDKSSLAEVSVDRSARDDDCLRFPAIEISRKQSRSSSLSEPSSTRFLHHNNGESRDVRSKTACHSYRNFTPRDATSKPTNLLSVSPFSLSSIRPKKFGGYRPSSGVILKNLSSGSESESVNEASRGLSAVRKIDRNSIATLESSSPEAATINGPIKKMPIMPARSDITESILPNLLPSTRSLDNDLDQRISQNTSRSCIVGQANRDGYELEKMTRHTSVKTIFNKRASCNELATKTSNELRQVEPKYEDICDQKEEMLQNMLTFSSRSFMSESTELVTSICNEEIIHDEPVMRTCNEFKQIESEFEDKHDETKEIENYRRITAKIYHDDIKDQFDFNCPTDQANFEVNSLENINEDVLDTGEWNRLANLYTKEADDTPHLIGRVQTDAMEEALSSRTSEQFGSEGHSRSSCTAKIYLQKEILSSRRHQNDIDASDKCDQEIITNVPTLALNSQDISYSTSAGSRECSATRPLDPHALIKALSDVSLKQERHVENVSRKREEFYRQGKDTIDISSGASDFPTKGETWRVSRSETAESPRKSLSRVPSKIPVRISSSKIISSTNIDKHPENSNKIASYEEAKFINHSDVQSDSIVHQRSDMNLSYFQICKRNSLLGSTNENIVTIVKEHPGTFAPGDEAAEYESKDYERESLISSNLLNPQSTSFGDHTYEKIRHLPESRFSGKSCPPVFFHKAVYSSDRDYARIDDDGRSRSDRSTSRKSMDTMDITSATESPGLSKYKKNESLVESLRNVEENITWRTEDECASINDEEMPENVKDYVESYNKKPRSQEESYLETKEHFKLTIEKMYNPLPFRTQHLQLDPSLEIEKSARKRQVGDDLEFNDDKSSFDQSLESTKVAQSENLMLQTRRTQELPSFTTRISSPTLNLNCEPKRKRKSQERFPFTISEASGMLPIKHKNTGDYQLPGESLDHTKMDDLEEKTVYQLKLHPSITRLAASGLEDTVTDILCCVAQEKKKDETSSKSRMKAFMRMFSSKLRKTSKQPKSNKIVEPAKIIYENRACEVDSKANSCSGDSSTEEAHRMNFDKSSNNRWIDHHTARSNPMLVSSGNTPSKTERLQAIVQEYPRRRYDRDDLWVQDIKDSFFEEKGDSKVLQKEDETNNPKKSPPKDRYSIFLAKDFQSDKLLKSNIDHINSPKGQHDVISGHMVPSDGKSKQSIDQKAPSNFIPEVEEIEEDLTGCLCWRLCRVIAPFKYRSSIKEQVSPSRANKPSSLLRKRKK